MSVSSGGAKASAQFIVPPQPPPPDAGGQPSVPVGGGGPAPDVPAGPGEPPNLLGITLFHNQVRAEVQTTPALPPLTWSAPLAATAALWVAQCQFGHNSNRSAGHPYYVGENIFSSGGAASAQAAVNAWVAEKSNYNYTNNSCTGVCGHYTQVVWRATREVGCAVNFCANTGRNFIVCNYGPGGNYGGTPPY